MVKKVSDIIAEFLEYKEIKTVFGIIGSANAHIFDSIVKHGYTEIIYMHHEQAVVMAMQAYYRTCGKVTAAIVTAGAGSSNAITGVISCWADSIPGLIIAGQESTVYLKSHKDLRMFGIQGFDSAKMVKDVTKYSTTVMNEFDIQNELEIAYNSSISDRYGPSWITVPFDIQSKITEKRDWNAYIPSKKKLDTSDIDYLISCLKKSERPVILGGHGIRLSNSKDSFNRLVNKLKIPVILSWAGIDLLEEKNEFFYGRAGIYGQRCPNFILQNSDLVLVLGSRLAIPQVGYNIKDFAPHAKVFVIDIDELEIKKYESVFHKLILCDCKDAIEQLLDKGESFYNEKWISTCTHWKEKYPVVASHPFVDHGYINSYWFMNALSDVLHDDEIIVTDMGTALLSGHQALKLKKNQKMFTSTGLGEMGYGLPAAIGASFANNRKQVLCLNCDGGIMFNLQELQTIRTYNLPIKIVIFNNDGYLMIKHTQQMLFKGDYCGVNKGTGLSLPDFERLAHAFGYEYCSIKNWPDYGREIEKFISSPYASICEVYMYPEQDFVPKIKGITLDDNTIFSPPLEELSPLLPLDELSNEMVVQLHEKSKLIKR